MDKLCELYQNTVDILLTNVRQKLILVYQTPFFEFNPPSEVARSRSMNRNLNDLRLKYVDYLSMTNLSRTCLDRIRCSKCVRFYPQKAFCIDEQYCDVIDEQGRNLYVDGNHLSEFGMARLAPLYRQLFGELAKEYRQMR